jgi:hypothetical protein
VQGQRGLGPGVAWDGSGGGGSGRVSCREIAQPPGEDESGLGGPTLTTPHPLSPALRLPSSPSNPLLYHLSHHKKNNMN